MIRKISCLLFSALFISACAQQPSKNADLTLTAGLQVSSLDIGETIERVNQSFFRCSAFGYGFTMAKQLKAGGVLKARN